MRQAADARFKGLPGFPRRKEKRDARAHDSAVPMDRENRPKKPTRQPDPVLRLLDQHRRALHPSPPLALKTYALGASRPMTLHVASDDKVVFEALRAAARSACGFPVTQLGAFALVVAFAAARQEEWVAFARSAS